MGHPITNNQTPFASELLQQIDEEGRTQITPVVKATLQLSDNGALVLAEEQSTVSLTGETWSDAEQPCYKLEPETAFIKPATDVVLVGHARTTATQTLVGLRVGELQKTLRVTGDRVWHKGISGIKASPPRPIGALPLSYERAYGGWDRSSPDASKHKPEPRNPVGIGHRAKDAPFQEGTPLPNIEDPQHLLSAYGGTCLPAGFGFIGPDWQPRAALAGSYDDAWLTLRSPLLPLSFQRTFFNAASPGLVARGYLRGDEPVQVTGLSERPWSTRLPGLPSPSCRVWLRSRAGALELQTAFDTLIIDGDLRRLTMLWRASLPVSGGLQEVSSIDITCPEAWGLQARPRVLPFPARA